MAATDEKLIAALLDCGSVRAAARRTHCSATTIRARLDDPIFRERYQNAKKGVLKEATDAIVARLTGAADALAEVMSDSNAAASVRVSAADAILRHGLRYLQAGNIIERLDALEAENRNRNL